MHRDRTTHDPARLELKRCSACTEVKRAEDFYLSRGRLSSYCKGCQRQASRIAYRRRRQDPAARAQMRSVDRLRKRQERTRLAQLDPDRERRFERARRAALRRLIAAYEPEYRSLLSEERAALEGSGRSA
jgi:hypothetical protein